MRTHLVGCQDSEGVDDLFGSVGVGALAGHEVEEGVEVHIASIVGIDDGQDALEVHVALSVLADRIAQRDEARLELLGRQAAGAVLVEVIEAAAELVQLLLADALGVAGEDLVLHLVDVAIDRGEQLLPADAQRLHRIVGVSILEDHRFLHRLVDLLQLLDVRLVRVHGLLVLLEPVQLILQRSLQTHANGRHRVHLALDPGSNDVGLLGKLAAQHLVVLLLAQLVGQRLVALRHQLADVAPLARHIVGGQRGVRVLQAAGYLVLLDNGLHLANQVHNEVELLVGLAQRRLELIVRLDQALDLLHGVNDEHVHQILARAIQPVVERRRPLCELQMQDVDLLQDALGLVQSGATALGEGTEAVPLIADALATGIHRHAVMVLQGAVGIREIYDYLGLLWRMFPMRNGMVWCPCE